MGFGRISKQEEQTSEHAVDLDDVGRGQGRTGQSGSGHFHAPHELSEWCPPRGWADLVHPSPQTWPRVSS